MGRERERERGKEICTLRSSMAELIAELLAFSLAAAVAGSSGVAEDVEVSNRESTSGRRYIYVSHRD